jgi:hypothetical protein
VPRSTRPDGSLHRSWSGKELQSPPNLNYAIQTKIEQQKAHLRRRNVGFLVGILSPASSSDWTGLALGLGIIPDCDERQDSDKNHDQTNRPPASIWVFHIVLLGALGGTCRTFNARGNAFYSRSASPWLRSYLETRSTMSPFSWE